MAAEGKVADTRPRNFYRPLAGAGFRGVAELGLQSTHGESPGTGGVAKAGEVKDPVKDVGEEFIAEAKPVALAQLRSDIGTDDDFPVGEGEDIGGAGIAEMTLMQPSAFPCGHKDDAEFRGQAPEPGRRQAPQGVRHLTTQVGQVRRMPSLTVDPPQGRFFWVHAGPWGSGYGGEGGFPQPRQAPCGRPATGMR